MPVVEEPLHELLLQALETELAGIEVYGAAIASALDPQLREDWQRYAEQTRRHAALLEAAVRACGLKPGEKTPARRVVHQLGRALVKAIESARQECSPDEAQVVAAECVILVETKDHQNWQLIGEVLCELSGELADLLGPAFDEVEEEEDEHLYDTTGRARELWMERLGLGGQMPGPRNGPRAGRSAGARLSEPEPVS
jgi:rubrerythrin